MKTCRQCGGEFGKRTKEAWWQFEKRAFCSRPCADIGRTRTTVPDTAFRARYRQGRTRDGRKRLAHRLVVEADLGAELPPSVHVHHRDQNRLNNDPGNLEPLSAAEHGRRHTKHPVVKTCVICSVEFTPHKTKRARQQTCGAGECKSALLSLRWEARCAVASA